MECNEFRAQKIEEKILGGLSGEMTSCPIGFVVTDFCSSGRDAECAGFFHQILCSKYRDHAPGNKILIRAMPAQGHLASCPKNFVMVGLCSSGKTADCTGEIDGKKSQTFGVIQCARFDHIIRENEILYSQRKRRSAEGFVEKIWDSTMFDSMGRLSTFGGDYSPGYASGNIENGGMWWSSGECAEIEKADEECLEFIDHGIELFFPMPIEVSELIIETDELHRNRYFFAF